MDKNRRLADEAGKGFRCAMLPAGLPSVTVAIDSLFGSKMLDQTKSFGQTKRKR